MAVYQSAIETFGEVDPFVEISISEQRHISALVNQFNKHGLNISENHWNGNVPIFKNIEQTCLAGVEVETAHADLYLQLLGKIEDSNLTRVFTK